MQCPACGAEVVAAAVYCHKCGQRLDSAGNGLSGIRPPKSRRLRPEPFQQVAAARWEAKDQPEEELWRGGYSSKAMIGSWVISGCVSLASAADRHLLGSRFHVSGCFWCWRCFCRGSIAWQFWPTAG